MAVPVRAVGAAVVLFLIPLGGVASGANTASFADAAGDGNGGPDITSVTASSSDDGVLTLAVRGADAAAWTGWGADVLVDSDADYATGHDDGVDHVFSVRPDHTFSATRWDGGVFAAYGSAATGTLDGNALTVTVPLRELGNTTKLAFAVVASTSTTVGDQAPDGSFAPGTPPRWQFSPGVSPRVTSLVARFSPARPRHGARFAVTSVTERLSTGETRVSRSAGCRARLDGARLAGRCSWRVPAGARGRRLAVSVSAHGISHLYSFSVR